jgi:hypothetical protein
MESSAPVADCIAAEEDGATSPDERGRCAPTAGVACGEAIALPRERMHRGGHGDAAAETCREAQSERTAATVQNSTSLFASKCRQY